MEHTTLEAGRPRSIAPAGVVRPETAAPARDAAHLALARYVFALAALAVAAGVFARLGSLDRKLVFQDEAYSFVRVAGYFLPDIARLYDGRVHTADDFARLQRVTPARGIGATAASLAEEPGRAPLYYLVAKLWIDLVGDGLARARALSAVLGIAGIGLAYLLVQRLTASTLAGAVAAACTALSPILVRFSGQLREYILIADLTLLSTWLLSRAMDRGTQARWIAYGVCVAAGIYTSVTFAALVAAQGCALVLYAVRRKRPRLILPFACAAAIGLLTFVPWLLYAAARVTHGGDPIAFASEPYSLGALMIKWAFNLGAIFFDSEFAQRRLGLFIIPLLALIGIAVWYAVDPRANPHGKGTLGARLLLLAAAGSTLAPLVVLDILRGSHLQGVVRYSMTSWTGIELLVVLLISAALLSRRQPIRAGGLIAFTYVAVCGLLSVFADRPYDLWWDNNEHLSEQIVARTIGARGPAIILASGENGADHNVLVLSRYLPRGAKLLLGRTRLAALPRSTKRAYLFLPTVQERRDLLRSLPRGSVLANISPPIGLKLPDLRSKDPDGGRFSAGNALWELSVP